MKYLLITLLLIGSAACNKRTTCSVPGSRIGAFVAFKGFVLQELDTIVVQRYPPDGLFAQLQKSDTLIAPALLLKGDTALGANGFGGFMINEEHDFKVVLPVTGRAIRITGIRYRYDAPYTYQSDDKGNCTMHGAFFSSPDTVAVEQVPVVPGYYNGSAAYVFLKK